MYIVYDFVLYNVQEHLENVAMTRPESPKLVCASGGTADQPEAKRRGNNRRRAHSSGRSRHVFVMLFELHLYIGLVSHDFRVVSSSTSLPIYSHTSSTSRKSFYLTWEHNCSIWNNVKLVYKKCIECFFSNACEVILFEQRRCQRS